MPVRARLGLGTVFSAGALNSLPCWRMVLALDPFLVFLEGESTLTGTSAAGAAAGGSCGAAAGSVLARTWAASCFAAELSSSSLVPAFSALFLFRCLTFVCKCINTHIYVKKMCNKYNIKIIYICMNVCI